MLEWISASLFKKKKSIMTTVSVFYWNEKYKKTDLKKYNLNCDL